MYLNIISNDIIVPFIETPKDFDTYTIPKIKEWARTNGLKVPSGMKKSDLIKYIIGLLQEKKLGIIKDETPEILELNKLQPRFMNNNTDWLMHLHKYGWAVAPIPNWKSEFTQMFFQWLESCNPNFNSKDKDTWKGVNMPIMSHGILKNYFGHTELQWQIRELCTSIYESIWGCSRDDLLCSFDGGCFLYPHKHLSPKQWIHVDQNRDMTNFCCVQGIVNFEDNGPEDGGLVLIEGSHEIFNDYMNNHPSEGIVWGTANMNDELLSSRQLIKICAPPGNIILFDSRTFHCNVAPSSSSSKFRICTYVSMQPRNGASKQELNKRISLYEKGRMTNHWCYGPWFKETPEHPHSYGAPINKPPAIEIAALNPLRKRLIGYD